MIYSDVRFAAASRVLGLGGVALGLLLAVTPAAVGRMEPPLRAPDSIGDEGTPFEEPEWAPTPGLGSYRIEGGSGAEVSGGTPASNPLSDSPSLLIRTATGKAGFLMIDLLRIRF